ncbi:hypothetical protein [Clostridium tyrobutyricum]|uniref:hypothetical protein n=1 Tax=Clostridium tyrobutyricum TaxID=1519 RepID=UPI002B201D43|nr:hypothetical protein [Clostridium tyrobutyricum]MEA5008202.1 hypothetical protein [Clostridium tyrobutyricum]
MNNIIFISLIKIGTFMILFASFYFILKYTICKVLSLNKYVMGNKFYLDDTISIIGSILIIMKFIKF